jgi:hypothetical protein
MSDLGEASLAGLLCAAPLVFTLFVLYGAWRARPRPRLRRDAGSLALTARSAAEPHVRARALRELCEEDGDLGARTAAFLLPDEVPVVRLQAALLLGDRAAVRAAPDEARRSLLRDHPDTLLAMEELGDEDGLVAGLSEGGTTPRWRPRTGRSDDRVPRRGRPSSPSVHGVKSPRTGDSPSEKAATCPWRTSREGSPGRSGEDERREVASRTSSRDEPA